jgi:hypothetical protein
LDRGNVASLIEKPGVERSRDRVLSDEDMRRVWRPVPVNGPPMCALMRLRLVTAPARRRIITNRWTDIEGDWRTFPGTVTKNSETIACF